MSKVLERNLGEDDFFAWTQRPSRELRRFARTRPNLPLDFAQIAGEIADLVTEGPKLDPPHHRAPAPAD